MIMSLIAQRNRHGCSQTTCSSFRKVADVLMSRSLAKRDSVRCRDGSGHPRQLDTNSIECCEFSSTAAAILPKYSVSPAGRPTPMTTRS